MAQQLRAVLRGDPCLVPSTYRGSRLSIIPVSGNPLLSSDLLGHQVHSNTHIHGGKAFIYIK